MVRNPGAAWEMIQLKKGLAIAAIWTIAAITSVLLLAMSGPMIESALDPVLSDQRIANVSRHGDRVCWEWTYKKTRYATPLSFSWTLRSGSRFVSVAPVEYVSAGSARPPGLHMTHLCTVIQQEFAKASGLNLLGSIEYNPAHNLWSLWQATPEFQVPGPNGP
jgi:hypothetical protein